MIVETEKLFRIKFKTSPVTDFEISILKKPFFQLKWKNKDIEHYFDGEI